MPPLPVDPYATPTAAQFTARFPEFARISPTRIDMFIDEALSFVGKDWFPRDYQPAVMFYAAHYLWLEEAASRELPIGDFGQDSDSEGGGFTSIKLSEVTSVKVGDTSISLSSTRDTTTGLAGGSSGTGAGGSATWSDQGLSSTIYGQRYLDLRRRSNPEVKVIVPRLW